MKNFHRLQEIVNTIHNLLYPISDYDLKWLLKQDNRKKLFEKNPKCMLKIMNQRGREIPLLPICNRSGTLDRRLVSISMRLARRLQDHPQVNQDHLSRVIKRLNFINRKLCQKDIKTTEASNERRRITNFINSL